jgi:hypothetical protein
VYYAAFYDNINNNSNNNTFNFVRYPSLLVCFRHNSFSHNQAWFLTVLAFVFYRSDGTHYVPGEWLMLGFWKSQSLEEKKGVPLLGFMPIVHIVRYLLFV